MGKSSRRKKKGNAAATSAARSAIAPSPPGVEQAIARRATRSRSRRRGEASTDGAAASEADGATVSSRGRTRSQSNRSIAAAPARRRTRSQTNNRTETPAQPVARSQSVPPPSTQSSEEASMILNGYHPITGLRVRTCICTSPGECRKIMWRYAEIGAGEIFPYFRIPGHPAKTHKPTGQHVVHFRKNIFHHLYGQQSGDIKEAMKEKDDQLLAMIHFHPEIRPIIQSNEEKQKQNKWRVPLDVGRRCGLTKLDRTKVGDTYGNGPGQAFMASPTWLLKDATKEVEDAEREHNIRRAATDLGPGRRTPKERELDRLTKEATDNPRAMALRLQDSEGEITALKKEVAELKKQIGTLKASHKKDIGELNDRLTSELILTGLNRRSLLSEEYHEKKQWLSPHFFGRPWKEHVARGRALFKRFVDNFDVNVTGEEPHITPFEKYCLCCMIAWRGFTQDTVGAIYDRHRTQISRYMKEWMPLLGEAGADCSELDLEMNHNFFDVQLMKDENIPYMEGGVAFGLVQPSNNN